MLWLLAGTESHCIKPCIHFYKSIKRAGFLVFLTLRFPNLSFSLVSDSVVSISSQYFVFSQCREIPFAPWALPSLLGCSDICLCWMLEGGFWTCNGHAFPPPELIISWALPSSLVSFRQTTPRGRRISAGRTRHPLRCHTGRCHRSWWQRKLPSAS